MAGPCAAVNKKHRQIVEVRDRSIPLVAGVLVDQCGPHRRVAHAAHQLSRAGPRHRRRRTCRVNDVFPTSTYGGGDVATRDVTRLVTRNRVVQVEPVCTE